VTGRAAAPVIRRLLKDAPWAQYRLRPFAGHYIAWDIAGVTGEVQLDSEGMPQALSDSLSTESAPSPPGVHLSLPSEKLSVLGKGMDAIMREVRIEGNAGLAAELAFIARHLRPDPAEWLAPYLGDIAAEQLAQQMHRILAWSGEASLRMARSGADYAVHEARLFPPADAVSQHCDEIDKVRDASQRLEQRIARLEARLKIPSSS
jgi:ubiquinone biosynthesis accessory factor UbiJ